MSNEFESHKKDLKKMFKLNNLDDGMNIEENVDISYDENEILNSIYTGMGLSMTEVIKFNLYDEFMKLVSYMKEPEPGTYEYEMFKQQMSLILFWDNYEEFFDGSK